MNSLNIRSNTIKDITPMVILSKAKRLAYEQVQPRFWRYAENAEKAQTIYFKRLLND